MITTEKYQDKRLSIIECRELVKDVPKRRRFAAIYREWDNSLNIAEASEHQTPAHILYITVATFAEQRQFIAEWMAKCKPGALYPTGGEAVIVCTK